MKSSTGKRVFDVANHVFLGVLALLCLLPFVHIMAVSLSSKAAAGAGIVGLWPVDFTPSSYDWVVKNSQFLRSFLVSVKRVALGTIANMAIITLTAYPLSKEASKFRSRNVYMWIFVFTMLFSGGLIPLYMMVKFLDLFDSIWALILPIVPVFSIILMMNFFRSLPKELEESAYMDGADHLRILLKIFIPLSRPAIATLTLFAMVLHWNEWFYGLIFMNRPEHYPLQTYLYTTVIIGNFEVATLEELEILDLISDRTVKAAQIFIAAFPILLAYPFLQRHFVKGIVLGSVKG